MNVKYVQILIRWEPDSDGYIFYMYMTLYMYLLEITLVVHWVTRNPVKSNDSQLHYHASYMDITSYIDISYVLSSHII